MLREHGQEYENKISNIQKASSLEIESLKFKLNEALCIIDKDRREKLAIQESLKKA